MNQSHHIGRDAPKRSEHLEAVTLMRVVKLHEAKYPNLRLLFASIEQKKWIADLRAAGWKAEVCRGWSLAWDVIRQYVEAKA
jgi:hypothetical protein